MTKKENILIIGAGLCSALLALRLGQRGYNVRVIEMRPDLRKVDISAGRSINLAFSDRGIKAMRLAGIQDKVEPLCIPMNGRMIHDNEGNTYLSNYSGRSHEYINSISRENLTALSGGLQLLIKNQTPKKILMGLDDPYPLGEMESEKQSSYSGKILDLAIKQNIINKDERDAIWEDNVI